MKEESKVVCSSGCIRLNSYADLIVSFSIASYCSSASTSCLGSLTKMPVTRHGSHSVEEQ